MDHSFEVGKEYRNRNGSYTVLTIEEPKMAIRYEDGHEEVATITIQERIWQAMQDEAQGPARKSATRKKRHRRPPRHVTESAKEKIKIVMTYKSIPPGQMRLYKALWDVENRGLTFAELAEATHCNLDETRGTLGALGNRVTQTLGEDEDSRLLIEHWSDDCYYLSPEMLDFIEATSSFKESLENSEQVMFDRHTPTAWSFIWDEDRQAGSLVKFTR